MIILLCLYKESYIRYHHKPHKKTLNCQQQEKSSTKTNNMSHFQVHGAKIYSISGLQTASETVDVSSDNCATLQMQADNNSLPSGEPANNYLCFNASTDGNLPV